MRRLGRIAGGFFVALLGVGLGVALTASAVEDWRKLHHFADKAFTATGTVAADVLVLVLFVGLGVLLMVWSD